MEQKTVTLTVHVNEASMHEETEECVCLDVCVMTINFQWTLHQWSILLFRRGISRVKKVMTMWLFLRTRFGNIYLDSKLLWIEGRLLKWFYSVYTLRRISWKMYDEIVTVSPLKCGYVHWVPLTTSSITTSSRLQPPGFFASKSLTAMLKSSVATSTHL